MSTHSYPPEEIPDKDCYPNCSLRAATFHPTPADGTPIATPLTDAYIRELGHYPNLLNPDKERYRAMKAWSRSLETRLHTTKARLEALEEQLKREVRDKENLRIQLRMYAEAGTCPNQPLIDDMERWRNEVQQCYDYARLEEAERLLGRAVLFVPDTCPGLQTEVAAHLARHQTSGGSKP